MKFWIGCFCFSFLLLVVLNARSMNEKNIRSAFAACVFWAALIATGFWGCQG